MQNRSTNRFGERGSAGIKFLATIAVLVVIGNAGVNYIPVAYNAESLKSEMATAVLQGLALPGKVSPVDNVKSRIFKAIQQNDIPQDALVDVRQAGNAITAHVAYTKQVNILPFGVYKYNYVFDHTATPTGFLMKQ